jgi:hypothetical protein
MIGDVIALLITKSLPLLAVNEVLAVNAWFKLKAPLSAVRLMTGALIVAPTDTVRAEEPSAIKELVVKFWLRIKAPDVVFKLMDVGATILVLIVMSPAPLAVNEVPVLAVPLNARAPFVAVRLMAPLDVRTPKDVTVSPALPKAVREVPGLRGVFIVRAPEVVVRLITLALMAWLTLMLPALLAVKELNAVPNASFSVSAPAVVVKLITLEVIGLETVMAPALLAVKDVAGENASLSVSEP